MALMRESREKVLAAVVALVVYYPMLFAGMSNTDDSRLIANFLSRNSYDILASFIRNKGFYWRPLLDLSYFFDKWAWSMEPAIMHFENILMHVFCVVLVYAVVARLFLLERRDPQLWPLAVALLVAVHPIATESVCWISGRTDLLAGILLLAALQLLLDAQLHESRRYQAAALGCFFLACLCKETALFFSVGAVWMTWVLVRRRVTGLLPRLRACLLPWSGWVAVSAGYLVLRSLALQRDTGMGAASKITQATQDAPDFVRVTLKVLGFYFKKILYPLPLNFSIIEVADYHLWFGVVLILLVCYWLWRQTLASALFLTALALVLPALLVVFGQMAWTPVAERYLYLALPLVAAGLALGASARVNLPKNRFNLVAITVAGLLLVFAGHTLVRALQWQDGRALLLDTVKQSPTFLPAYHDLAGLDMSRGDLEGAEEWLKKGFALRKGQSYTGLEVSLAQLRVKQKRYPEARVLLERMLENPGKKYVSLANRLINVNISMARESTDDRLHRELLEQNYTLLHSLASRSRSSFLRYRLGKVLLQLGEQERAGVCFSEAYRRSPKLSHFREAALTLATRLGGFNSSKSCLESTR